MLTSTFMDRRVRRARKANGSNQWHFQLTSKTGLDASPSGFIFLF